MLVQRTAGEVGEAFLRALVREYAALSGARLVYVADHHGEHAHVLAEWREGPESAGGEFVLPGRTPLGPASVTVPLRDADGAVFGHVGVEGVEDVPTTRDLALFTLLAMRTAGEVQRHRYVAQPARGRAAARGGPGPPRARGRRGAAPHRARHPRRRPAADRGGDPPPDARRAPARRAPEAARAAPAPAPATRRARRRPSCATSRTALHPVGLTDKGLSTALEILAERSPVPLHVDALPARRLPEPVEVTVFFLVSEAVSNAGKHARATALRVEVVQAPDAILATVSDDGGAAPTRARLGPARPPGPDRDAGRHPDRRQPARRGHAAGRLDPARPVAHRARAVPGVRVRRRRGRGRAAIASVLAGRRTGAISVAREWDLEGGVPGIGTRLPIRDHTGREHGAVVVRRVSILPLGQVDAHAVAACGRARRSRSSAGGRTAAGGEPRDDGLLPGRAGLAADRRRADGGAVVRAGG